MPEVWPIEYECVELSVLTAWVDIWGELGEKVVVKDSTYVFSIQGARVYSGNDRLET